MKRDNAEKNLDILAMATEIVAARAQESDLSATDLSMMFETVYGTIARLAGEQSAPSATSAGGQKPAISVKNSIKPDYIVCLEDGKEMKMLRRHLRTAYGMTPEQYREKWNLPADYPMTAPNYAKKRSALAKDIGLGKKRGAKKVKKAVPAKTKKKRRKSLW